MRDCVSGRWAAIAAMFVSVGLAGCGGGGESPGTSAASTGVQVQTASPVAVTVATVETRPVERRVSVVGTLFAFEEYTISAKVEGRADKVLYEVGDRVQPGAVLVELDPTEQKLALEEAQRALDQELAKLGLTDPPTASFDIGELPSVERARLLHDWAVKSFERQKQLMAKNAASKEGYEQAETDLSVADAALKQVRLDVKSTLAAIKHRQAVVAQAKQRLDEMQIRAPQFTPGPEFAGADVAYVVARRYVSVGEMVRTAPDHPVYDLVLDDLIKLRTKIPERHLGQVQVGQEVEVRLEAFPNDVFPAKVSRIDPIIDSASRTFLVEALVPNPEHRLKHGGFAKADAVLSQNSSATTVPLEAVVAFAGVTKVFRVDEGQADEVEVLLGARGAGWVEVIGSLNPSDVVATSGQSQLADGTSVEIRTGPEQTALSKP